MQQTPPRGWGLAQEGELQFEQDIEWFRPDPRRRLYPMWAISAVLMAGGILVCAWSFVRIARGQEDALALTGLIVGLLTVLAAMGRVVFLTVRVLSNETCVGLRVDGLVHRDRAGTTTVMPWSAIDSVRGEGARLVLYTDEQGPGVLEVPTEGMDLSAQDLSARILDTRRKALMGLLTPLPSRQRAREQETPHD